MAASPEHAPDVEFWREAQLAPGDALAAQLDAQAEEAAEEEPARRKRRRRRGNAKSGE